MVDGIEKRLERVLDRDSLRAMLLERVAIEEAGSDVDGRQADLGDTRRRIARLVEALASGSSDLPSIRGALVGLEAERQRLERAIAHGALARRFPGAAEADVDQFLDGLGRFKDVLAAGAPEERKAVVRAFL